MADDKTPLTEAGVLAAHFKEMEQRTNQPWRKVRAQQSDFIKIVRGQKTDIKRSMAIDNAKLHLLTADEVMSVTYLLFCEDADIREMYAGILLQKRGLARTQAHNWFVAEHLGEDWLTVHGEALVTLTHPLFPPTEDFRALNTALIMADTTDRAQGGAGGGAAGKLFLDSELAAPVAPTPARKPAAKRSPQGGALPFPVHQDPTTGAAFVDLEGVQQAFQGLTGQVQQLLQQAQHTQQQQQQHNQQIARRLQDVERRGAHGNANSFDQANTGPQRFRGGYDHGAYRGGFDQAAGAPARGTGARGRGAHGRAFGGDDPDASGF